MSSVSINQKLCKGCQICVFYCPKKVLDVGAGGKAEVVASEQCNACGLCVLRCPDYAVQLLG